MSPTPRPSPEDAEFLRLLGRHIQDRRKRLGYTQQALAQECGCTTNYLAHVEGGMYAPSLGLLRRLAVVLDLNLDRLIR
jgi:transcriptional regulator with XRE-family HTH domain